MSDINGLGHPDRYKNNPVTIRLSPLLLTGAAASNWAFCPKWQSDQSTMHGINILTWIAQLDGTGMANGSRIFCSHFKTILHLFFNCHYAMFLWTTIHIGFNINNIVGIYKIFIGLLDGRYQIIVWSYWHGHLHCLCTLATQVWSMSTKNYMHEAYAGGHQRRTKGVDDSCITYIGINGHANFLLHGWTEFL